VNQASPDLVGRIVLGRYRVVRAIGRGGMGVIYLARSEGAAGFVKPFVIKQAAPDVVGGDLMMAQLAREARIMSNLRHPGIVSVIDFAEQGGSHLLVLDYVQGYNLGQWRRFVQHEGKDFPAELALHVVERVLDALDYAHGLTRSDGSPLGIVHRDISPGNVLLDVEGHVKLADFGVARMSSDHTESSDGHMIKGKISYMAPELFAQTPPTPSSDVYACAVMLHELLVGRNEFKAETVPTTAIRVMQHVPSNASSLRGDISRELDRVLQRALAKSPLERFASAREFADALNRLRTMSPEQAARQLTVAVKRDFHDPRMATLLGVEDPTTLERAWRDAGTPGDATGDGPTMAQQMLPPDDPNVPVEIEDFAPAPTVPSVTVAAAPVALAAKAAQANKGGGGHTWSIAFGLGGLVLAACALVLVLRSQRSTQEPERVIVVDSRAAGAGGAGGGSAPLAAEPAVEPALAVSAPVSPAVSAPAAAAAHPAAEAAREGSAQSLSAALARRQDQIAKCFATPGTDVSGTAGLSVRFEVDTEGHVVSAHVLPATLSGTALGQCIEGVARGTDFGPQPHPVTFRIPMTARKAP
jgi:serine/threonine protein kinase